MRWWGRRRAEHEALRAERDADLAVIGQLAQQVADLTEQLAAEQDRADRFRQARDLAYEPPAGECTKIRLTNRPAAERFADHVEQLSPDGAELEPYRCQVCPRQPVTCAHYWHVGHADPAAGGERGRRRRQRKRAERRYYQQTAPMTQRIDTEQLRSKLRSIDGGSACA